MICYVGVKCGRMRKFFGKKEVMGLEWIEWIGENFCVFGYLVSLRMVYWICRVYKLRGVMNVFYLVCLLFLEFEVKWFG